MPDENEIQTSVCAQIIYDHPMTNFCYNVDEKEGLGPGKRFGLCVLMLATNLGVAALLVGLEAEMGAFCKCIKGEQLETWPFQPECTVTGDSMFSCPNDCLALDDASNWRSGWNTNGFCNTNNERQLSEISSGSGEVPPSSPPSNTTTSCGCSIGDSACREACQACLAGLCPDGNVYDCEPTIAW